MSFHLVDDNLRQTLCLLASCQSEGEVRDLRGFTMACAGVRFSMFNAALISAPVTAAAGGLPPLIARAAVEFQTRGLDWSCWYCENWLESNLRVRAGAIFAEYGMQRATAYPGMVAERVLPPGRPLPRLEIRRVGDDGTRLDFCQVGCACFHLPVDWFCEVFEHDAVWQSAFTGYVGYVDGQPVTTAATLVGADSIGVYNVATLPEHQRKGYAEAITRHGIEEARRRTGIERSVLQSTAQGFSLYVRMGYRTVTRFSIYVTR